MGRQFSFIGWDELTSWPNDSAYLYLLSRLRATEGSNLRLEVRATCTPGGIGHSWVKSRWGIPNEGGASEVIDSATGFRRVFIPARISDNPFLRGGEYEKQLQALPEATRKALLLGRWDVFEGQVFAEWNYNRHTCREFELPFGFDAWLGADDGYSAPACVLLFAYSKTYDRIFIMDEIYQRGLGPVELAREIRAMCRRHGRETLDGVIDSSAFAEVGLGTIGGKGSRGDIMNAHGCDFRPSPKGAGSRVAGVSAIHQRLKLKSDGFGGLIITRNCRNLIRTLPAMTYDRANPEDIDPACEEHAVKALMYGLTRRKISCQLYKVRGI